MPGSPGASDELIRKDLESDLLTADEDFTRVLFSGPPIGHSGTDMHS